MSENEKEILKKFRGLSEENKLEVIRTAKILSFKYHNGSLTSPSLAAGYEPPNPPVHGNCKIDFIWDLLP
jgi:hypothetical protein